MIWYSHLRMTSFPFYVALLEALCVHFISPLPYAICRKLRQLPNSATLLESETKSACQQMGWILRSRVIPQILEPSSYNRLPVFSVFYSEIVSIS
jgi:hypothetical protein